MNHKLALASGNQHKIIELATLLSPLGWDVSSPKDLGVLDFDPEENGVSFEENAHIKSQALFEITGLPSLADDSGLVVEALNGEPGIYSARYGGKALNDRDRAELVLEKMSNISNRNAYFICVLSFRDPTGIYSFEGIVNGKIGSNYQEGNGFGYDPIFFHPGLNRYFSEISSEEKNKISHRGIALQKFLTFIQNRDKT
ncbi:MAG: RdgB/HAM1 family non-canonical purine NTP pyrophosphatase [Leptospira sp.]|nr:RdgB/HAM1 family non-canonical purine NTP pyrophosphatase [Leptospira sp.]